jgi:hypothetical protein
MRLGACCALWACVMLAPFAAPAWSGDPRPTSGSVSAEPSAVEIQEKPDKTLAAIKRWKEKRTVRDFFIIVEQIPKGTPAKEVVEKYLGEPKQRSGYWASVTREWYYIVEPPPDGSVCTVFISQDEKFVGARDKRKDK